MTGVAKSMMTAENIITSEPAFGSQLAYILSTAKSGHFARVFLGKNAGGGRVPARTTGDAWVKNPPYRLVIPAQSLPSTQSGAGIQDGSVVSWTPACAGVTESASEAMICSRQDVFTPTGRVPAWTTGDAWVENPPYRLLPNGGGVHGTPYGAARAGPWRRGVWVEGRLGGRGGFCRRCWRCGCRRRTMAARNSRESGY